MSATSAMIGTSAGALFGLFSFFILQGVASHIADSADKRGEREPASVAAIRIAAWADLVIFPVVGYFVGPLVLNA